MDFKFGRCIHTVHANKSPLRILDKRESGRIQGLPEILLLYVSFRHEHTESQLCAPLRVELAVALFYLRIPPCTCLR